MHLQETGLLEGFLTTAHMNGHSTLGARRCNFKLPDCL